MKTFSCGRNEAGGFKNLNLNLNETKMNREIKFRVWEKNHKKWIDNFGMFLTGELLKYDRKAGREYETVFRTEEAMKELLDYDFKSIEIMQFTGLKDKNGIEIYEGDIMKMNIKVGNDKMVICSDSIISFSNGSFWWTSKHWGMTDCCWHFYNEQDREVIGNIYENSELINGGKK